MFEEMSRIPLSATEDVARVITAFMIGMPTTPLWSQCYRVTHLIDEKLQLVLDFECSVNLLTVATVATHQLSELSQQEVFTKQRGHPVDVSKCQISITTSMAHDF